MNILIVGSGAREHAIALTFFRSKQQFNLFCCGTSTNPGIKQMTLQYWVGDITDTAAISEIARTWQIDLAIIGPEAPLKYGLADKLWESAIPTIGPKQSLAQIETSKAFARNLMKKYNIPGLPRYQTFTEMAGVSAFLEDLGENNYVVKANGLMGGKGVKVAGDHLHSFAEALAYCKTLLDNDHTFVIEEKLIGQEFSLMGFCDGKRLIPMPAVQDHKRAFVDDKGPNTGGMGSYTSADHLLPFLTLDDVNIAHTINETTVQSLMAELNEKYIGIFYGNFILTKKGIFVIEFNARFGDPEAMNVLTILESDLVTICQSMVLGQLTPAQVHFAPQATVCKYIVPEGYPDNPIPDAIIDIAAVKNKARLYLSAVNAVNGKIHALGTRTAAYVGVADSISLAEEISEKEIRGIGGPFYHRTDIGTETLIQRYVDAIRRLRGV
ncbi:MAG TPA: phosphoribosylamine--glycine ligase [Gammaproteobacteria bacterium]|jgi:phosphoribosylamine--glycine ligase|nr:phosphoribosylamine--glycine ligase [Gammaproteobacteria bacterium]